MNPSKQLQVYIYTLIIAVLGGADDFLDRA